MAKKDVHTITRRKEARQSQYPQGRFWIRFMDRTSGERTLTVDPSLCPHNIHAWDHWEEDPDGKPVDDEFHGDLGIVLARCLCTIPEPDTVGQGQGDALGEEETRR